MAHKIAACVQEKVRMTMGTQAGVNELHYRDTGRPYHLSVIPSDLAELLRPGLANHLLKPRDTPRVPMSGVHVFAARTSRASIAIAIVTANAFGCHRKYFRRVRRSLS